MRKILRMVIGSVLAVGIIMVIGVAALAWPLTYSRWTGGGSFFTGEGMRVTHGFELYSSASGGNPGPPVAEPNNLEVNWEGNRFHLTSLDVVSTYYDSALDGPKPPKSSIDNVIIGEGTGRYNGVDGATISFTFTDQGEPGTKDSVCMTIWDADGNEVLFVEFSTLMFGNHQSHLLTGGKIP